MNEDHLRRLLSGAVPDLPAPEDRVAAVGARVRQRRRYVVVGTIAGAMVAAVLMAGIPVVASTLSSPPANPGPEPTRNDGVIETPGCATYRNAGPTAIDGTPVIGNSDIVNGLANRIVPYASEHFADVFTQTEIVTDLGRLRVYRKPSSDFDAWILRDFAQDCVEIADAAISEKEFSAMLDRIFDDQDYWRDRGVQINSGGGNPVDGTITITVQPGDLEQAQRELPAHYPDLRIIVQEGTGSVPYGEASAPG